MYRAPRCKECECCKSMQIEPWIFNIKEYKCCEEKAGYQVYVGCVGIDHLPKTSPIWCPKRVKGKKLWQKILQLQNRILRKCF